MRWKSLIVQYYCWLTLTVNSHTHWWWSIVPCMRKYTDGQFAMEWVFMYIYSHDLLALSVVDLKKTMILTKKLILLLLFTFFIFQHSYAVSFIRDWCIYSFSLLTDYELSRFFFQQQSHDPCRNCQLVMYLALHHFNNNITNEVALQHQLLTECAQLADFEGTAVAVHCTSIVNNNIHRIFHVSFVVCRITISCLLRICKIPVHVRMLPLHCKHARISMSVRRDWRRYNVQLVYINYLKKLMTW